MAAKIMQLHRGRPNEMAFRSLIRTLGLLKRVMEPHFARFGISGSQWGVLRTLHRAQEEEGLVDLRLIDLGDRLLIRTSARLYCIRAGKAGHAHQVFLVAVAILDQLQQRQHAQLIAHLVGQLSGRAPQRGASIRRD